MGDQISNISSIATEVQNITGKRDPILEVTPEDGTAIVIEGAVRRGDEIGIPIYAVLEDTNGNDLPQDTEIALEFQGPTDDQPYAVTDPWDNIRAYNTLSVKEQQNEEYIDSVKHDLKGQRLVVEAVDTLYVSVDSSAQIDWANSRLTIDGNAVQVVENNA